MPFRSQSHLPERLLTGLGFGVEPTGRHNDGCFIAVFKVDAFRSLETFRREVTEFAEYLKSTPPAEGFDEVKVVDRQPDWSVPWQTALAPPSLCISTTVGTLPQRLACPREDHSSANSPMLDEGVMG